MSAVIEGYREAAPPKPRTVFSCKFSRNRRAVLTVPMSFGLWVAFMLAGGGRTVQVSCVDTDCIARTGYLWLGVEEARFTVGDVRDANESSSAEQSRLRLYHHDGSEIPLRLDAFHGSRSHRALLRHLAEPVGELSVVATPSNLFWFYFMMGVLVLAAMIRSVLRTPLSLELAVAPLGIEVTERWLWRRRRRRMALDHPTEIRVLEQPTQHSWLGGDVDAAVIEVVDADGRTRPITDELYPHAAIERAAEALRGALDLNDAKTTE